MRPILEAQARAFLAMLKHEVYDGCTQLRVELPGKRILSGFFDNADDMIDEIKPLGDTVHIWISLNPIKRSKWESDQSRNRLRQGSAASADDVLNNLTFVIDIDATRPSGVSATDDEKARAREVRDKMLSYLEEIGVTPTWMTDSGNGYHIGFITTETLATDMIADAKRRLYNVFSALFDNDGATIDRSPANHEAVITLPGTYSIKGENSPERPHRQVQAVFCPNPKRIDLLALADRLCPDKAGFEGEAEPEKAHPSFNDTHNQHKDKRSSNTRRRHVYESPRNKIITKMPPPNLKHERLVMASDFKRILFEESPGLHIFRHATGMGKTYSLATTIQMLVDTGKWPLKPDGTPKRLLWVSKRHEDLEYLKSLMPSAFIQRGRDDEPESPYFCQFNSRVKEIAESGHNVGRDVCKNCPARQNCAFEKSIKEAKKATIVAAPYGSYLNAGNRLEDFEIIVVDEDLLAQLVEVKDFDRSVLGGWVEAVALMPTHYPAEHAIHRYLDLFGKLLQHGEGHTIENALSATSTWRDLGGDELPLLGKPDHDSERFKFEASHMFGEEIQKKMLASLLFALRTGQGEPKLYDGGIKFGIRRANVINALKNKLVINLDATPTTRLLEEVLGPLKIHGKEYAAPNTHIIQIPDQLYAAEHMRKPETLAEVSQIVNTLVALHKAPLVVAKGEFVAEYHRSKNKPLPPSDRLLGIAHQYAQVIWYGSQTRASNDYQHCDAIVLVGHYQEALWFSEMAVSALSPVTPLSGQSGHTPKQYDLVGDSPNVLTRDSPTHPDPFVQEVIDQRLSAEITQAIGRLRAINRPEPLPVYLVTGTVFPGLPIDELVRRTTFTGDQSKRDNLTAINHKKRVEALAKIEALRETGYVITPRTTDRKLAKDAGVSRNFAAKYLKEIKPTLTEDSHTDPDEAFYEAVYRIEEVVGKDYSPRTATGLARRARVSVGHAERFLREFLILVA